MAKRILGTNNNKQTSTEFESLFPAIDNTSTLVGTDIGDAWNRIYNATLSQKPNFNGDGTINYIEYFATSSQVTSNRVAKSQMTYSSGYPATETVYLYSLTDGTTILKTITRTFTFSGDTLTKIEQAVT